MSMLGNINARLPATKNKVDILSSHRVVHAEAEEAQPSSSRDTAGRGRPATVTQNDQDDIFGTEEQVCARITEHLRDTLRAYLPTIDDESDADNRASAPPSKKPKGTSGEKSNGALETLRTSNTTVVIQITWPMRGYTLHQISQLSTKSSAAWLS